MTVVQLYRRTGEICRRDYLSLPSETIPVPATVRGAAPHACGGGEARGGIGEVDRGCGANTGWGNSIPLPFYCVVATIHFVGVALVQPVPAL